MPEYPDYCDVPAQEVAGMDLLVLSGHCEYSPRSESAPPPVPVAAKVDRKGYATRRPARSS